MNKILIFSAVLFIATASMGQTVGTIKGKLVDSLNKQSLKDASITVLDARDSSLDVFGLAKADGTFNITNISFGTMLVQVKFEGYEPYSKKFVFSKSNAVVDLGTIYMKGLSSDLGNVTVSQSAIRVKNDTVEYNASSFKTKPNAVAEDLLKKLPGMEVASDGTVKSQGEQVQRVLVDGKRFFGDDPKMATRNLPPDVIDKIQVFDDLSDQSKFTGFDDGNRVKTINITTKKDKRQGYFGKAVLSAGTDEDYDESFNLHRFNGNQQMSLLGQGNDINKQNFTQQDILGSTGGRGAGGGNTTAAAGINSTGVTTTWAAGMNYKDSWSKDIDAYGSYFYNNLRTVTDQKSLTQNILTADSSLYNNQTQSTISSTPNHRVYFNYEDRFDSSNSMVFRPNVTFQTSTPSSNSSTVTTGGPGGTLINSTTDKASSYNTGYSINGANLQLRHKFKKRYRTVSLDMNLTANANNGNGYNYSVNSFYIPTVKTDTINQYYIDSLHSYTFSPTLSYTEPLTKNQIIELRYNFSHNYSNSVNNTYRFGELTQKYNVFDSLYSNSYKYTANSNTVNLSWRLQKTKYNMNIGTGVQFTDLNSDNTTKNVIVARNYVNLTPTINFTYNYTRTTNLRIFYTGRTGQPSTSQLQPVSTTSDSINFQIGNPNLKPQFTHSLRVLYTSFDPFTQRVMFATINATAIANDIQSSIIQNANGGKTTTYVNLGGTYTVAGYFLYGFPLKKPKSNLNFQTNVNYSQSQSLLRTQASPVSESDFVYNTVLGETIRWTTNLKNNFDMNLSNTVNYTIARNSLQTSQNLNYYTETVSTEFTYYTNNGWIVASQFDYTYNGNRASGYNASIPLLSPAIAKQFLKNKAGELRLSCFDILNKNTYVNRTVSTNVIVDSRTNTLTRYFLLTFTYNLRNFNSQQQQRMPGFMRGMFPGGGMPGGAYGGNRRG